MAAQARHYEKNLHYTSRQDEKYISKNHHHLLRSSSRESSPFKPRSNNSSPLTASRKRPYESPKSYSQNSSCNSSFLVVKGKDRSSNLTYPAEDSVENEDSGWSQHISSSGKVYFYNKKTEQSQWEMPSDWIIRDGKCVVRDNKDNKDAYHSSSSSSSRGSCKESFRGPLELSFGDKVSGRMDFEGLKHTRQRGVTRDSNESRDVFEKDSRRACSQRGKHYRGDLYDLPYSRSSRDSRDAPDSRDQKGSRELREQRDFRDSHDFPNSRDSPTGRESHRKETRGFWELENSPEPVYPVHARDRWDRNDEDMDSGDEFRKDNFYKRYNSEPVRTIGLSTCALSTSTSRNGASDSTVQDISPPSTPSENSENLRLDTVSPLSLLATPQRSASIGLNLSSTPFSVHGISHPQTPLASPKVLAASNSVPSSSPPTLHPLQQALLLQQQQLQQQQLPISIGTNSKSSFGSPHLLASGKSAVASSVVECSSPQNAMISSLFLRSVGHASYIPPRTSSSTPPPPPPPPGTPKPGENQRSLKLERLRRDNADKREVTGTLMTVDPVVLSEKEDSFAKAAVGSLRFPDERIRARPSRSKTDQPTIPEDLFLKTERTLTYNEIDFEELPDLERCKELYSNSVIDFTASYYGNILERQANACWDETMASLASDGYRTKSQLSLTRNDFWVLDTRLSVACDWFSSLDQVALKLESLQDSKLTSEGRPKTKELSKSDSMVHNKDGKSSTKGSGMAKTLDGHSQEAASPGANAPASLDAAPALAELAT